MNQNSNYNGQENWIWHKSSIQRQQPTESYMETRSIFRYTDSLLHFWQSRFQDQERTLHLAIDQMFTIFPMILVLVADCFSFYVSTSWRDLKLDRRNATQDSNMVHNRAAGREAMGFRTSTRAIKEAARIRISRSFHVFRISTSIAA